MGMSEEDPRMRIMVGAYGPSKQNLIERCLQPYELRKVQDPRMRIMLGAYGPSKQNLIERCLHPEKMHR